MDTPQDARYDRITALAARLVKGPFATIEFFDEKRSWIKSAFASGKESAPAPDLAEVILRSRPEFLALADTGRDQRFAAHPQVKACLAVPLCAPSGHIVGVLAVFDSRVRPDFDAECATILRPLAEQAVEILEHDAAKRAIALRDEEVGRLEARIARLQAADPAPSAMPCALFLDRLSKTLAMAPLESALVFVDVHAFTRVNIAFGRAAGDEALREIAARIRECIGHRDTFSRRDADHFAILVDEFDTTALARLRARLEAPLTNAGVAGLRLTFKFGGVRLREVAPGERPDRVLQLAECASAESVGAVVFATPAHRASVLSGDAVLMQLISAVEQGSIDLHYQPLIDAATRKFVGYEALARWTLPDGIPVSPAQFMSLADRYGQAFPLGEQLLRKACSACCEFVGVDPDFVLHVNVSPVQLANPLFEVCVNDALRLSGMPAKNLCLEITEAAVANPEIIGPKISRLRRTGLRFALDDFGMGYSSLSHIRRLPVDAIKIDRFFVSGAGESIADPPIVRTVTTLAKELGLLVVAEGVETEQQAEFLRGLGCDLLQGYLFGRPAPLAFAGGTNSRAN